MQVPHFLFDLKDISKVIQGLVRAKKTSFESKESLLKLWAYGCIERRIATHAANVSNFGVEWKSLLESTPDKETGPLFTSIGNVKHDESHHMEITDTNSLQKNLLE